MCFNQLFLAVRAAASSLAFPGGADLCSQVLAYLQDMIDLLPAHTPSLGSFSLSLYPLPTGSGFFIFIIKYLALD